MNNLSHFSSLVTSVRCETSAEGRREKKVVEDFILCHDELETHLRVGPGGIARPFSTQIISVNRDVKQISVGFKKVTVEASEMTVGYMTV